MFGIGICCETTCSVMHHQKLLALNLEVSFPHFYSGSIQKVCNIWLRLNCKLSVCCHQHWRWNWYSVTILHVVVMSINNGGNLREEPIASACNWPFLIDVQKTEGRMQQKLQQLLRRRKGVAQKSKLCLLAIGCFLLIGQKTEGRTFSKGKWLKEGGRGRSPINVLVNTLFEKGSGWRMEKGGHQKNRKKPCNS